ncbi:hypothetical protein D3C80_905640 [compost metagenome]
MGQAMSSVQTSAGNAIRKLRTMATPPPRGVGTECELREFGISIKLRAKAYWRNAPVAKNETPTTATNNQIVFKGQLPETAKINFAIELTLSLASLSLSALVVVRSRQKSFIDTHGRSPAQQFSSFAYINLQRPAKPLR